MKPANAAERVRLAQVELAAAERELVKGARPWLWRMRQHRGLLAACSGFASGLALTLLPTRWWARLGATAGTVAAGAARSALTPAVIGALVSSMRRPDDSSASQTSAQDA